MANSEIRYVVCPFYRTAGGHEVTCEGVTDASQTKLSFPSNTERIGYCKRHCFSMVGHRRCRVAEMLYRKYDE
ncbi:MAG: hypothetical protein IJV98_02110 [Clostridia bacterium]|nr:hypothetical protein [Clostridia bacterium]